MCYPIRDRRLNLGSSTEKSFYVALQPFDLYGVGGLTVELPKLEVKDNRIYQGSLAYAADTGIRLEPGEGIFLHPERGALQGLVNGSLVRALHLLSASSTHLADVWQEVKLILPFWEVFVNAKLTPQRKGR